MGYNVKIQPADLEFRVSAGETVLESAIKSNVYLEHSCMDGSCGTCKAKLIQGSVSQLAETAVLSEDDVKEGFILTCCSQALSNIELVVNYYPELTAIKRIIQPCKVDELSFPASDIAILKLRIPPTAKFKFLAGQYIQLIIKGEHRSYSIANISETYEGIELHIRKVIRGLFSDYIFNELKVNQLLRLEGPMGTFFVRKGNAPVIFLAGGTGFAPVKSMVEQLIKENTNRKIFIYWGSTTESGFYSDEAKIWQNQHENIKYIPVLSGTDSYRGRKGVVHRAVLEDLNDLIEYEVYACGSPIMIEAARKDFILNGLKPGNFYSDAFVSSDKKIAINRANR